MATQHSESCRNVSSSGAAGLGDHSGAFGTSNPDVESLLLQALSFLSLSKQPVLWLSNQSRPVQGRFGSWCHYLLSRLSHLETVLTIPWHCNSWLSSHEQNRRSRAIIGIRENQIMESSSRHTKDDYQLTRQSKGISAQAWQLTREELQWHLRWSRCCGSSC